MNKSDIETIAGRVASLIANQELAIEVVNSIANGLTAEGVVLSAAPDPWAVFKRSLDLAVRDIESHPIGHLFKRLIRYGPIDCDTTPHTLARGNSRLSDEESGRCVEFIFSHMVNRFKGELAELLAIEACMGHMKELWKRRCPDRIAQLFFGDTIKEPCRIDGSGAARWAKGADGLLVCARHEKGSMRHRTSKLLVYSK